MPATDPREAVAIKAVITLAHHFGDGADDDPFVIGSRLDSRRTEENAAQRVWFDCAPHPYGDPALVIAKASPQSGEAMPRQRMSSLDSRRITSIPPLVAKVYFRRCEVCA